MAAVQRSPRFEHALTEACVTLADRRQAWLTHLDVDARPVAWGLAFFVNGTLSEYMTTYDLGFAAHSPGQLRLLALVKYAISRGIRRVDMGRGYQSYKCWFGATAQSTRNVLMYVRRPRTAAFVGRQILRERVGAVYERAVG
jgi:CelD/BcsL family acetyltransferase involved in cellulose biosynthesis